MKRRSVMSKKLISLVLVLAIAGMASAIQWIGNGTGSPAGNWNVATNWDSLRTPIASDSTVKAYLSSGLGANIYVDSAVSGGLKTQMATLGPNALEVRNGGSVTEAGSWELFNVNDTITIRGAGVINACTTGGSFKIAANTNGTSTNTDIVNVYGTLNVKGTGTSVLGLCNDTRGTNVGSIVGTVNVRNGGLVDVDGYIIGTNGTGTIVFSQGGQMKIKGNATAQLTTDIGLGRISGINNRGGALGVGDIHVVGGYTYIPEPATLALLGLGGLLLRRKR